MSAEIIKPLSSALELVGARHGVTAYLYGSHALDQARPGSDIDITVLLEGPRNHSSLDLLKPEEELEKQTG